jgi:hypothetical protein
MSLFFDDGHFPFCIQDKVWNSDTQEWQSVEIWDGSTWFRLENGAPILPSATEDALVPVVGPGTQWPIGLTLEQLSHIYWMYRECGISAEIDIQKTALGTCCPEPENEDDPPPECYGVSGTHQVLFEDAERLFRSGIQPSSEIDFRNRYFSYLIGSEAIEQEATRPADLVCGSYIINEATMDDDPPEDDSPSDSYGEKIPSPTIFSGTRCPEEEDIVLSGSFFHSTWGVWWIFSKTDAEAGREIATNTAPSILKNPSNGLYYPRVIANVATYGGFNPTTEARDWRLWTESGDYAVRTYTFAEFRFLDEDIGLDIIVPGYAYDLYPIGEDAPPAPYPWTGTFKITIKPARKYEL